MTPYVRNGNPKAVSEATYHRSERHSYLARSHSRRHKGARLRQQGAVRRAKEFELLHFSVDNG